MSGDGPTLRRPGPGDADDSGTAYLDEPLARCVRELGANVGAIYLCDLEPEMFRLALLIGAPVDFFTPWLRVPLATPTPGTDAIRQQQLVWVGNQQQMVDAYPGVAVAVPYPFVLAAAPISGTRRWGALLLLWPPTHSERATRRERRNVMSTCARLARLVDEHTRTRRYVPPPAPRVLSSVTLRPAAAPQGPAAADFAARLPDGALALDLQGRVTYVSPLAAELLGRSEDDLAGTLPWQSLPWLDDPVYEDRYRAAVFTRQPVAFAALRPPNASLHFRLYPDSSGISVLVRPAGEADGSGSVQRDRLSPVPARVGRLYQLMHLATALTEAASVRDVVDLVADQIVPAFDAHALVLYLVEAGRLRVAGHRGYPAEALARLDGSPLNTGLAPSAQATTTGAPLFLGSRAEFDMLYPGVVRPAGQQAWAVLPLTTHHEPVGCCVMAYERPHAFDADERAVLTSLAGLIAQALERARLYDVQYELAHGLQQALLPDALPDLPGLETAASYLPGTSGMEIGGDFYDLIRLSCGSAAAVIGDVQGHNVAAAALMGQIRTAIRAHATATTSPAEVLSRTNRLLLDLDSDLIASCMYVELDLDRRQARLASAGHLPPLLGFPGQPAQPLDIAPGPLLGVDPGADYPMTHFPLDAGTLLALYTDGLVESPDTDLDQALASHARQLDRNDPGQPTDLDALIDALLRAVPPTGPRTDDIAVLLLHTLA
ncbi:SpoIIE family protein phosphatase [Streptacidiphilus fuscans]|uniref:protein-serine/threonine phosphatase n=1 Tax=Streptacidiphilus fuscans TaxID=2789292 RepID=A0A931B404_9ACTN|nr:SpoIIE family protein phosphatase [Streptacidiphilus fuscans]MBF9068551.1 SpoIIE family protein phosphatase [Streptacidiphilus fuscans]